VHELSVCQALLAQVDRLARDRGATAVNRILIDLGPLSGVDGEQLEAAFAVMRRGGVAAAADLAIRSVGVRVACADCRAETDARPNRLLCAACGSHRTRLVAGDELMLMQVEMRMPEHTGERACARPAAAR
jgi:hydrogenase nickel incorporation protein HypA/HybF